MCTDRSCGKCREVLQKGSQTHPKACVGGALIPICQVSQMKLWQAGPVPEVTVDFRVLLVAARGPTLRQVDCFKDSPRLVILLHLPVPGFLYVSPACWYK